MKTLIELRGNKSREEVAKALDISVIALTEYEEIEREPRDEVKLRMFEYYGTKEIIFYSTHKMEELQKLLKKQYIDFNANEVIKLIPKFEKEFVFMMHHAYNYGVIQGKREERARRKKGPEKVENMKPSELYYELDRIKINEPERFNLLKAASTLTSEQLKKLLSAVKNIQQVGVEA